MAYTTLKIAKSYVQPASGEADPVRLTATVNKIRRQFYNWYAEVQLFVDVVECYHLHRFCADPSGRGEWFMGFTKGREVAAIESMWWNDWPVTLRTSWREWQPGLSPWRECHLEKFDLPGFFSTFADLVPGQPKKLRFTCDLAQDEGKALTIRGVTPAGTRFEQEFSLSTQPRETSVVLSSVDQQGGIVKDVTVGRVNLADEEGRILGIYEPDETVPSMSRVKVTGVPQDCRALNVRSARRYFPVYGENDVVETDNQPAWDAMARYIRSFERADKSLEDTKIEQSYVATAKVHVVGDRSREIGKSTRSELRIATPGIVPYRMRLGNQRGGHRW